MGCFPEKGALGAARCKFLPEARSVTRGRPIRELGFISWRILWTESTENEGMIKRLRVMCEDWVVFADEDQCRWIHP
jgi:hypothetical protein